MQMMSVEKLVPHPKNNYFFDDIKDEPWFAFIDSIQTSGVIEPIIATQDNVIVSGHQRVRACKELGIKEVAVEIRHYESEDEILKQLIETNICQRGIGNVNAVKMGRCLKELERIEGIRNGGNRGNQYTVADGNNFPLAKTQAALAEEIGITPKQWRNYKSLTDLVPELQDAVQTGTITATTAYGLVKKLTPDEQKQLAEKLSGSDKKRSGSEVNALVSEIKAEKAENDKLRRILSEKEVEHKKQVSDLEKIISERPVIREQEVKEVEVVPADYNYLKGKAREASAWEQDYKREQNKVAERNQKILELQDEIKRLQEQTVAEQAGSDMKASAILFAAQCKNFIEAVGGYVFLAEHLSELPERERKGYLSAVQAVHDWAHILQDDIERGERS